MWHGCLTIFHPEIVLISFYFAAHQIAAFGLRFLQDSRVWVQLVRGAAVWWRWCSWWPPSMSGAILCRTEPTEEKLHNFIHSIYFLLFFYDPLPYKSHVKVQQESRKSTFLYLHPLMQVTCKNSEKRAFLGPHYKQDLTYVFPEMKLRCLVPNFHIHLSVCDLYRFTFLLQQNRWTDTGNI